MDRTQREQTEEKIQWLSRYRKALRRQQLLAMDLEQARGMVLCHAPAVDGMPRASGHSDRTGRAAERLMRAETRCAAAAADTHRIRSEVQWSISTVFDPTQRELLRRRYLLGQTLTEISEQMHLEYRWVRRLHRKAVLRAVTELPPAS
ncbi:hypothetical protein INF35_11450 [Subdoligranulum sp. DSM 109015]|uniref:RNA polymerase sigma-70 region 4 domain-containing protein n=1 Tax=Gemmiger gallinarum TaxID=2779354 RepID=A0ABR9R5I2_9FIRM|nr:sigma factor-like helix-turn-helix DNA-binding protein [Gemmiger gallinarum]MBE5038403.1 hypothetical protein [Gemmiger gallinarum]